MRDVDPSLIIEEIREAISWPGESIKINKIERLKFRDSHRSFELVDSSSIKLTIESNLLPEFVYIFRVRCSISPYINRVRRCINCSRWGHSSMFCKNNTACPKCGDDHTDLCPNQIMKCVNCNDYHSFDTSYPAFLNARIINTIMTYCNVNQFTARKLMKSRNISSPAMTGKTFRSSAFLNSALGDFQIEPRVVVEDSISESSHHPLNPLIKIIKPSNKNKNKYKMYRVTRRRLC